MRAAPIRDQFLRVEARTIWARNRLDDAKASQGRDQRLTLRHAQEEAVQAKAALEKAIAMIDAEWLRLRDAEGAMPDATEPT